MRTTHKTQRTLKLIEQNMPVLRAKIVDGPMAGLTGRIDVTEHERVFCADDGRTRITLKADGSLGGVRVYVGSRVPSWW